MKVLSSWLHEFFASPVEPAQIAAAFDDLGTPVEEEVVIGGNLDGIVVAKVLDLSPHPNADKIQLVQVDAGNGEALQICCGAFNMAVGDLVPLATLGTTMPGGMHIERRKMRGEWSNGMLCSARELELGTDHAGIHILEPGHPLGTPIAEALGIEVDVLWELEINPNRPDAMSVAGLARDVAAKVGVGFTGATNSSFTWSSTGQGGRSEAEDQSDTFAVDIVDADGCGRFVTRLLRNIDPGAASPAWMRSRLEHLGMRPINALVDISNYVMLEMGQPNHAYDKAKIAHATLGVRRATQGEKVVTLDDLERTCGPEDLLIVDGADSPVGIAGIMGGAHCEVDDSTTEAILEMAWFDPISISRSSRRLGLRSEASSRFEKGADPGVIEHAADRFCQLASEICGATVAPVQVDVRGRLPERPTISVRVARVNAILGTNLDVDHIAALLNPIGFGSQGQGEVLEVDVPTWRFDTSTEIEVIEEIARHLGYRNIPNRQLTEPRAGSLTPDQKMRRSVRRLLCGLGYSEAQPLPFLAPGQLAATGLDPNGIELLNPLVAEESVLRTALLPGLASAIAHNEARRQAKVGLWEIGHVFLPPPTGQLLPDEREHLGVVLAGREAPAAVEVWQILADALRLHRPAVRTATLPGMHPTRAAAVLANDQVVGVVGEIDPVVLARLEITERVAYLEVDLGGLFGAEKRSDAYRQVSKFPSSDIDLAFSVAEEISAIDVEETLAQADPLVWRVRLFDTYRGHPVPSGTRSLAYTVRLQAPDRTLTDAEVSEIRSRLIGAVEKVHGVSLRS